MELQEIQKLGEQLLIKHNLSNWRFEFDNAKRRYGCCKFRNKTITLSKHISPLRKKEDIVDTILHEIAHAIVGPRNGHNDIWRKKAIEIGCNGERCGDDVRLEGKWVGVCPNGHTSSRHRKPKYRVSCGKCSNVRIFDVKYLITYTERK